MVKGQIRQGDVLLIPAENISRPENLESRKEAILAFGEITGHAHRLAANEVYEWEVDGQRVVQISGKSYGTIAHEEHDSIPAPVIEPNVTYRIVPQQEWNLKDQWQKVKD